MEIINHIVDLVQGKYPADSVRSEHWPKVREQHLAMHPVCVVCGGTTKLNVHHIKPFHLYPDLELDPTNLVTLCEAKRDGVNCHLFFGHLGNFRSFNENVREDAPLWGAKLMNRPLG